MCRVCIFALQGIAGRGYKVSGMAKSSPTPTPKNAADDIRKLLTAALNAYEEAHGPSAAVTSARQAIDQIEDEAPRGTAQPQELGGVPA